jgi:peptidoglycan/xylan/chitin deacetylase (PgdA/CDA1 family)
MATGWSRGSNGGSLAAILALLLSFGASAGVTAEEPFTARVPVLMYHRITRAPADARWPGLWVAPARFRAHMLLLKRHGWRSITAEQLGRAMRERRPVGPKRFVITIDDGHRDGYRNAAPILAEAGFVATYCVVPGYAQKSWKISFAQMRKLRAAGHEIANHSLTHVDLASVSGDSLRRQVDGAHQLIAARVGHAPRSLCYPYGRHDAEARRAVRRAGHLIAFTTAYGATHSRGRLMRSPRVRVNGWDRAEQVLAKVSP